MKQRVWMLCVLLALGIGQILSQSKKPLSEADLVDMLRNYVPPARVAELAREMGINFSITDQVIKDLKGARADNELISSLRDLARQEPASANIDVPAVIKQRYAPFLAAVRLPDGKYALSLDHPADVTQPGFQKSYSPGPALMLVANDGTWKVLRKKTQCSGLQLSKGNIVCTAPDGVKLTFDPHVLQRAAEVRFYQEYGGRILDNGDLPNGDEVALVEPSGTLNPCMVRINDDGKLLWRTADGPFVKVQLDAGRLTATTTTGETIEINLGTGAFLSRH